MPTLLKTLILQAVAIALIVAAAGSAHAQTERVKELGDDVLNTGKGAPVLVNFWATWCGPCRYEFPELVSIDNDYSTKGLVTVVISLDRPTFAEMQIPEFLGQYGAKMPSFVLDFWTRNERTRAIRRVAPNYRGGIPFTVLFDRNGKIVYQRTGIFDPKTLRVEIDKALDGTRP